MDWAARFSYDRRVKRIVLASVLTVLVLVELYLCTVLLPLNWQNAICDAINAVAHHTRTSAYDYSRLTHPAIDSEIEQVLREHIWLRITLYAVFAGLWAGNTVAIVWLGRAVRRPSE